MALISLPHVGCLAGQAVTGLDARNGVLVARAVLAAGGHHEAAEVLAGVGWR